MLWISIALMCALAIGFAISPLVRSIPRAGVLAGTMAIFVVSLSTLVYWEQGSPNVPSGASNPMNAAQVPELTETVNSLEARLLEQPDDLNGWNMLGRSHMTLGNYAQAVRAYERVVELEAAQDKQTAQSFVNLGESLLASSGQSMSPRTISLFENALALEPGNPAALFWGGIGASNRGDLALAADRWERLLATDPPVEVREVLRQRIQAWRGEPMDQQEPAPTVLTRTAIVAASISVSADAAASLPSDATVYVIARDPAQPSPPIAVTRRRLSELPAIVELRDSDSMVPGRSLSGFTEFELLARVSVSGSPAARPGDWFAATIVNPDDAGQVELLISEEVD